MPIVPSGTLFHDQSHPTEQITIRIIDQIFYNDNDCIAIGPFLIRKNMEIN